MRFLVGGLLAAGFGMIACAQPGGAPPSTTSSVLPKDIDPTSYSRLPAIKRDDLDADGKRIYDDLAGGQGKTLQPTGPAPISMYSPKAAEAIQMLNQYLRFHGVLKQRDFEVVILVTAREFDQQYEWSGHEMGARSAKVPQALIDAIKYNKPAEKFSERDTLLVNFARQLVHQHKLDADLYANAVAMFGKQGTMELATIVGDYAMAAIILTAAGQHLPPGREALLPAK